MIHNVLAGSLFLLWSAACDDSSDPNVQPEVCGAFSQLFMPVHETQPYLAACKWHAWPSLLPPRLSMSGKSCSLTCTELMLDFWELMKCCWAARADSRCGEAGTVGLAAPDPGSRLSPFPAGCSSVPNASHWASVAWLFGWASTVGPGLVCPCCSRLSCAAWL